MIICPHYPKVQTQLKNKIRIQCYRNKVHSFFLTFFMEIAIFKSKATTRTGLQHTDTDTDTDTHNP